MSCYCSWRLTGCLMLNCSFYPIITQSHWHIVIYTVENHMSSRCASVFVFQNTNEAVLAVEFSPTDTNNIISCGKSHVYFWTMSAGTLTKKQGIFGVSPYLATKLTVLHCKFGIICFSMYENRKKLYELTATPLQKVTMQYAKLSYKMNI